MSDRRGGRSPAGICSVSGLSAGEKILAGSAPLGFTGGSRSGWRGVDGVCRSMHVQYQGVNGRISVCRVFGFVRSSSQNPEPQSRRHQVETVLQYMQSTLVEGLLCTSVNLCEDSTSTYVTCT